MEQQINNIKKQKIAKVNSTMILCSLILILLYGCICAIVITRPIEQSGYIIPSIYGHSAVWIVVSGGLFALLYSIYAIIEYQGANVKTKLYTALVAFIYLFCITFLNVAHLGFVSLFLLAFLLFVALLLNHELKKTNKKAYILSIPCIVIVCYALVCTYVLCIIN